jgi:hypothetical protein
MTHVFYANIFKLLLGPLKKDDLRDLDQSRSEIPKGFDDKNKIATDANDTVSVNDCRWFTNYYCYY